MILLIVAVVSSAHPLSNSDLDRNGLFAPDEAVEFIEKTVKSRTLSGHLSISGGGKVSNIKVVLTNEKWLTTGNQTFTDENGYFSFGDKYKKGKFYLEFSRAGFNPLRVKIKITQKKSAANEISLVMHMS